MGRLEAGQKASHLAQDGERQQGWCGRSGLPHGAPNDTK
jgi:hypothetical protein